LQMNSTAHVTPSTCGYSAATESETRTSNQKGPTLLVRLAFLFAARVATCLTWSRYNRLRTLGNVPHSRNGCKN
jgi:hypothetical protein